MLGFRIQLSDRITALKKITCSLQVLNRKLFSLKTRGQDNFKKKFSTKKKFVFSYYMIKFKPYKDDVHEFRVMKDGRVTKF